MPSKENYDGESNNKDNDLNVIINVFFTVSKKNRHIFMINT